MKPLLATLVLLGALLRATGEAEAHASPWTVFLEQLISPRAVSHHRKHRAAVRKPEKADDQADRKSGEKDVVQRTAQEVEAPIPRPRPDRDDAVRSPDRVVASAAAGEAIPVPRANPRAPAREGVVASAPADETIPVPKASTRAAAPDKTAARRKIAMRPANPVVPTEPLATSAMVGVGCGIALAQIGVDAAQVAPFYKGACGISRPVSVSSFADGKIKPTAKPLITCELAETLAKWLSDTVQPVAASSLGGSVTRLRVDGSYECRSRDHVAGARISEHAFGNAIDLSAFEVNGRWVEVGGSHTEPEQSFLDGIRSSACGPFKTVLGPGSDGYHASHLHLDLAKRRAAGPSRGLFCQ